VSGSSLLDAKEQVRQAIDIVDLVGDHIQLRRQGRNYVGLCPWHDDSRPSLQVNPERQSFRCWVCDIGGDIFSFMMKVEGVEFREALEMLAERAGISLQPQKASSQAAAQGGIAKRTLQQAAAWVEQRYHDCLLKDPEAEPARAYLQKRRITAESIEKFRLGFAPNERDWILRQAKGSAERQKVLEAIGVVARSAEGGGLYERFRGRLLFSIRNAQGQPVGIGGRVLPESGLTSPAKYVNSPETLLFHKSDLLYGLDLAKDAIRRSGTALVMEGYTDVIAAHQFGFDNAVAALGTAVGESHIRILKRFADRIVLVLDGDDAGQRRANEVVELFVAQEADLKVLTLPEGSDPCEFLLEHGRDAFADLLERQAVDALEHVFRGATRGMDLENDVHGASQALDRILAILAKAPRLSIRHQKVLQNLATRFRVEEMEVRRRLGSLQQRLRSRVPRAEAEAPGEPAAERRLAAPEAWIRELLEIVITHPECVAVAMQRIRPEQIQDPISREIYALCCRLSDVGSVPTFDRLVTEFEEPATKSFLVELDEEAQRKGLEDPHTRIKELIDSAERREVEKRRPVDLAPLRERRLDDAEEAEHILRIFQQEKSRQGISDPTDG